MLNETVSRVMLFPSAPYTACSHGSKLRSHKYNLLYLSALAENNKMDLDKSSHFCGCFIYFFMLKLSSVELLYAAVAKSTGVSAQQACN